MKIDRILPKMRKVLKVPEYSFLKQSDPFKVLITTLLSQRTRDENTDKSSAQLFRKYKTAQEIAKAPVEKIEKLIKPAGFYKTKARRIKEICKILLKDCNGKVPETLDKLISLPGIGRKTANCVLVYSFGKDTIPVDVHVHRISNRIGLVRTKTPEETEFALKEKIPRKYWKELNSLFVQFGQQICLPRNPKCESCPINEDCKY